MKYIYIAGPYTKPNPNHNVHKSVETANKLIDLGFFPYVPHLTHFWDTMTPRPYEDWLVLDLAWLEKCEALIRLLGDSPGADREESHAMALGLPVFYGVDAFLEYMGFHTKPLSI